MFGKDAKQYALVRQRDAIVGAESYLTVKFVELVAVPAALATLMGPVLAPGGTTASILVSETTVKVARLPLKVTKVTPVKCEPVIVTMVPRGPLVG